MMHPLTPPDTLLERAHLIPEELVERDQWLVWRLEARDGDETKVPYQALRPARCARVNDSATWAPFADALEAFADALEVFAHRFFVEGIDE